MLMVLRLYIAMFFNYFAENFYVVRWLQANIRMLFIFFE